jgi:hypothetical protein
MDNFGFYYNDEGELEPVKPFRSTFETIPIEIVPPERWSIWLRLTLYLDKLDKKYSGQAKEENRGARVRFFNWAVLIGAPNFDSIVTDAQCNSLRNQFRVWLKPKVW